MAVKIFLATVALIGLAGTIAGILLATGGSVGPVTGNVPLGITVAGFSAGLILILVASFTERRLWMVLATVCMLAAAGAGSMGVFSPWLSAAAVLGCIAILLAVLTKASDIAGGTKKGP